MRFCSKLAASSSTTVVASADVQYSLDAISGTLFVPAGQVDDYEGRVYQFNADGSSFWPITPNGGTFSGPPTVNGSKG
jgi:hypothetical protein